MSQDSFFSRWSKRKLADPADRPAAPTVDTAALPPSIESTKSPIDARLEAKLPETARQSGTSSAVEPLIQSDQPVPLPAIASLNAQSDFSPFMAKDVSPELRNQAMKLLFTDPHYNVMDRLDIYIDDYGIPDPLPPDWLRKMNQSKALRLFDDEEEVEAKAESATAAETVDANAHDAAPGTPPQAQIADTDEAAASSQAALAPTEAAIPAPAENTNSRLEK